MKPKPKPGEDVATYLERTSKMLPPPFVIRLTTKDAVALLKGAMLNADIDGAKKAANKFIKSIHTPGHDYKGQLPPLHQELWKAHGEQLAVMCNQLNYEANNYNWELSPGGQRAVYRKIERITKNPKNWKVVECDEDPGDQ